MLGCNQQSDSLDIEAENIFGKGFPERAKHILQEVQNSYCLLLQGTDVWKRLEERSDDKQNDEDEHG